MVIGLAAQLFSPAGADIDENTTNSRSQLELDYFQLRAGPLESTIDLKLEILQPSTGRPAHELVTRLARNICRPVGIYLVDRPLIATSRRRASELPFRDRANRRERDRPAIRENDFALCQ